MFVTPTACWLGASVSEGVAHFGLPQMHNPAVRLMPKINVTAVYDTPLPQGLSPGFLSLTPEHPNTTTNSNWFNATTFLTLALLARTLPPSDPRVPLLQQPPHPSGSQT